MRLNQSVILERFDRISGSVLEKIRSALRASGYPMLWHVECEYHEGIVTLRGRVPTYYLKQVAQSIVLRHPEVEELVNQIEVV